MAGQTPQSPFLDVRSFVAEEAPSGQEGLETLISPTSPFLSVYEAEEGGPIAPQAEEHAAFLNELYDEDFDQALFELASEAAELYEARFSHELADPTAFGQEAERVLEQHFAPLASEAEAMIAALAAELSRRDSGSISESELDALGDQYRPSVELSPSFENFLKKFAKKALKFAKKGISVAAKLALGPLGPLLNKLKPLVRPLLKAVLRRAISKLPGPLQEPAKKLAERLPFLQEFEEGYLFESTNPATGDVAEVQQEFDRHVANLLFARGNVEQDWEVAQAITESRAPLDYSLLELDRARAQLIDELSKLKEGEDPSPHFAHFIPLALPALRLGIRLAGRKRVVGLLAKLLGPLMKGIVGPKYAPALSRAIVDAGLRLISLEATPEDEARAAGSAVAATVEDTVRRVAALPDYVLDNQELFEGFALEAFEQAAVANLPPILSEGTYRKRPDLLEAKTIPGTWILCPLRGRKCYKRRPAIEITLTPNKASAIATFGGEPLSEFLEEQVGALPGESVEAKVHLYEAIPGTTLSELARLEQDTPGLGFAEAHTQLHPLTPEAAGLLFGEPDLGREVDRRYLANPYTTEIGQRFYYLEIPGKRPLMTPEPGGRAKMRRRTRVRLVLHFPGNQVRIYLYLSEIRAQETAAKLRQQAHVGMVAARLERILKRGLRSALTGGFGLKIIHEAVTPDQWMGALRRLPSLVPRVLLARLQEWALGGLSEYLKQQAQQFIAAAEEPADGVTLTITVANPPGFAQLGQALKGKVVSLASLRLSDGVPAVTIGTTSGLRT